MKTRIALLIAALLLPGPGQAWIAYGFRSGMSRFDVETQLADRDLLEVTEDEKNTRAVGDDGETRYRLGYCSTPHRLYRMHFRLADSPAEFMKTLEKYQRRYGTPEGLDAVTDYEKSGNWEQANISLIWNLSESEAILLLHRGDGTIAEFQDTSVCANPGE